MKRQKLTENEARRLGEAIAAEARALGFVGKEKKMPKEIKRRIRARVLKGVCLDIENYCTVRLFFEQTYL
ncbi:hypothetical protein PMI54_005507 [Salmonella enterica]|nr:hypothetical protein [Salmonella enterica]